MESQEDVFVPRDEEEDSQHTEDDVMENVGALVNEIVNEAQDIVHRDEEGVALTSAGVGDGDITQEDERAEVAQRMSVDNEQLEEEVRGAEEVDNEDNEYVQQEEDVEKEAAEEDVNPPEEILGDQSYVDMKDQEGDKGLGEVQDSSQFFHPSATNLDQSRPTTAASKQKSKPVKRKSQDKARTKRVSVTEVRQRIKRPEYPNGPFRAKLTDETKISQDLMKVAPSHDYFGFIFSAQSQRPPNYYYRYILPVYKQPLPRQHMCITGERVPVDKIHKEKCIMNQPLPLSSLKLRWRSTRVSTVYKLEDLYAYLTVFGNVDGVFSISVNSAYVVFSDVESARSVVMCPCLGFPWDPLIAEWVEPKMNNFGFYNRYLKLEEPALRMKA
ncbi:hypothetical protein Btru_046322 [Bulinus truncatus]|nr:hypothetical protein Btru_046322 [Bulinus truncatus]